MVADLDGDFAHWSYRALAEHVAGLACGLIAQGLAGSEPVAVLGAKSPAWIIACLGIIRAGAIAVPLDHRADDREIARALAHAGCRRGFVGSIDLARLDGTGVEPILLDDAGAAAAGAMSWRRLSAAPPAPLPMLAPEQIALLVFTSGTTGVPKGVPLSHGNLVANLGALSAAEPARAGERVLLPLPLHHTYPFTVGLLGALSVGATLLLPAGVSGPQLARALRAGNAAVIIGVPGLFQAMLDAIEARLNARGTIVRVLFNAILAVLGRLPEFMGRGLGRRLFARIRREIGPRLRLLSSGGAHLDFNLARRLELLGFEVLTGYGLTETAPILSFNRPGRANLASEGQPVPGVDLRIAPVADRDHGEIQARGPNVFAGYWNNPEATAAVFTEDRWLRTGDLGFIDQGGFVHVVGRVKEVIVLADGKNLYPEEIEAVYRQSPFVREVAALAGERGLVALAVPDAEAIRGRGAARAEMLIREDFEVLGSRLRPDQRVSGLALTLAELPRTTLGKLKRHLLPALYRQALAGATAGPAPPLSDSDRTLLGSVPAREVWDWLQTRFPGRPLSPDTSLQLDLGVDSLGWIALGLEIQERFGLFLGEDAIGRILLLRDLLHEVNAAAAAPTPAAATTLGREQLRWLEPIGGLTRATAYLLFLLNRAAMRVLFRIKVTGGEHLPAAGALVIAPNHASYLDPFVIAAALPWQFVRRTYWAGWTGRLFANALVRAFSRAAQVVPVDPDRGPAAGLAIGAEVLRRGLVLVWFPEGRRSPTGEIAPFLAGVGMLIKDSGARAWPALIVGSFEAWPRGRRWPRPHPVSVTFGAARTGAELDAQGQGDTAYARIADGLRRAVAGLSSPPANARKRP